MIARVQSIATSLSDGVIRGVTTPAPRGTGDCPDPDCCPGERVINLPLAGDLALDDSFLLDHATRGTRQLHADQLLDWIDSERPPVSISEHTLNIQSDENGRFAVLPVNVAGFVADASLYVGDVRGYATLLRQDDTMVFRFGNGDLTGARAVLYLRAL